MTESKGGAWSEMLDWEDDPPPKQSAQLSATRTAIDRFDPDYSARNDRWLTPLTLIRSLGEFDLDPCGAPGHSTAGEVWTPEEIGDGLSMPWFGRVWLNPPYGRTMGAWLRALDIHGNGIALVPARVDTKTFHEFVFPRAAAINFKRGRVTFHTPEMARSTGSTFATVLIAYGAENVESLSAVPGAIWEIGKDR